MIVIIRPLINGTVHQNHKIWPLKTSRDLIFGTNKFSLDK